MIHITPCTQAATLQRYYRDHLRKETEAGRWLGTGAAALGLAGREVEEHAFRHVVLARAPDGTRLLRNDQRSRISTDLVVAAPKCVSILALVAGDPAVLEAHRSAVRTVVHEIEAEFVAALLHGKAQKTGSLLCAHFLHRHSRENDPHLHSHVVCLNVTQTPTVTGWRSMEPRYLYKNSRWLDRVYQSELAYGLRQAGYEVRNDRNRASLVGVPPEAMALFSKSRARIDLLEKRVFQTLGNRELREWVNDRFRKAKPAEPAGRDAWQGELPRPLAERIAGVHARAEACRSQPVLSPPPSEAQLLILVKEAKRKAFARTLFPRTRNVIRTVAEECFGQGHWPLLKEAIQRATAVLSSAPAKPGQALSPALVQAFSRFVTPETSLARVESLVAVTPPRIAHVVFLKPTPDHVRADHAATAQPSGCQNCLESAGGGHQPGEPPRNREIRRAVRRL